MSVQQDIARQASGKCMRRLADPGHGAAHARIDGPAINQDVTRLRRCQTGDQRKQRGFSRTARTCKRDMLTVRDKTVEAGKRGRPQAIVTEADIVEFNVEPVNARRRAGALRIYDLNAAALAEAVERLYRRLSGGTVVPNGGEFAQGFEKGGRKMKSPSARLSLPDHVPK